MSKEQEKRTCYGCANYFGSYFCGYISSNCKIYGSLDMDQHERHPDITAETCEKFEKKKPEEPKETQQRQKPPEPSRQNVNELRLTHKGRDNWERPVYEDENGRLWKDIEPRPDKPARICTALYNSFDGEPDTPLEALERYKDARIIFVPERDTWE